MSPRFLKSVSIALLGFASPLFVGNAWDYKLQAAEVPKPYDSLGQVRFLSALLGEKPERYRLFVIDAMENHRPYASYAASTDLDEVRYVFKAPDEKAFLEEQDISTAFSQGQISYEQSLFLHFSFNTPGVQGYQVRPQEPVRLPGQPFRASLWVHSDMVAHTLYLLFRNSNGKEVRVNAGPLLWHGWRRLDLHLPPQLFERGKRADKRYTAEFTGFFIQSHAKEKAGDVSLMIDNFLLVTDILELSYPGAEISDTWK